MKGNFKRVIANLALMGAIGFVVGISVFLNEWFKPKRSIVREKPAYTLTCAELANDFVVNPGEAEAKYLDKVLQVSGTVSTTEIDAYDNVNLIFSLTDAEVQVSFLGDFNDDAAKVEKGDYVELKGNYTGYTQDDIFGMQVKLNNGYLVKDNS
jgi:hypothetical protein